MRKKTLSVLVGCMMFLGGIGCSKHGKKTGLNVNPEPLNPTATPAQPAGPHLRPVIPRPAHRHIGRNLTPLQRAENSLLVLDKDVAAYRTLVNSAADPNLLNLYQRAVRKTEREISRTEARVLKLRAQEAKTEAQPDAKKSAPTPSPEAKKPTATPTPK